MADLRLPVEAEGEGAGRSDELWEIMAYLR
jgi:hypothetical protein